MSRKISGKVVDDSFTRFKAVIIETPKKDRLWLPISLLPENQQNLIKLGDQISVNGKTKDKHIVAVEGDISIV
ncbi:MAG: hypothetical protein WCV73_02645 [Patescibacteria group bacterium]|jgi:hypothetical protein